MPHTINGGTPRHAAQIRAALVASAFDWSLVDEYAHQVGFFHWPSRSNAYLPSSARDESAAMAPAAFRTLIKTLVRAPASV
jgi:hypothetical protein